MKKLIANLVFVATALFGVTQGHAQSDNTITWKTESMGARLARTTLELDIKFGTRFAAVNGLVVFQNEFAIATTGTCFIAANDRAICDLSVDYFSLRIDVSLETLNGEITSFDESGYEDGWAELILTNIE